MLSSLPNRVLNPAFIPTHTTLIRQPHPTTCIQQCIRSFDQLSFSKTQTLDQIQDDDLVALPLLSNAPDDKSLRLCVIRNQQYVFPLVRHEDDVETDLFLDPKYADSNISLQDFEFDGVEKLPYYGVGWYGQREGYGAPASEIWTIEEDMLEKCLEDGVEIPFIDVGMAHGEKARGGALF